jgi:hypothetical protein
LIFVAEVMADSFGGVSAGDSLGEAVIDLLDKFCNNTDASCCRAVSKFCREPSRSA